MAASGRGDPGRHRRLFGERWDHERKSPMAVIHSRYRDAGAVTIDGATCTDCASCAQICPTEVLRLDAGKVGIRTDSPLGCIACGHCMMVCPEQSVTVTGRGLSPADLTPLPAPSQRATAEALAALLQARRSVRRFTAQDVDSALLERIVAQAASGPMGIPPWDVGCVVVRGRAEVRHLAAGIIQGYAGFLKVVRPWLLTALRPFVRKTTYERFRSFIRPLAEMYVENHRQGRDLVFYDAPAVLLFHHSPYADLADATIACTYAMLAAEALGLGTTMIGGAAPMLQRTPALCRRLGIPPNHTPAIALILGYPATHFLRTVRRRFVDVTMVPAVAEAGTR
jgi:Fe-S-cluster-containing hydrogenase component 2